MANPFQELGSQIEQLYQKVCHIEARLACKNAANPNKLLTIAETCQKLNVSKSTLNRWVKQGYLHPHRIGGRVYYKEAELINHPKTGHGSKQDDWLRKS